MDGLDDEFAIITDVDDAPKLHCAFCTASVAYARSCVCDSSVLPVEKLSQTDVLSYKQKPCFFYKGPAF